MADRGAGRSPSSSGGHAAVDCVGDEGLATRATDRRALDDRRSERRGSGGGTGQLGRGAGASGPALHMQLVDPARLGANPAFGDARACSYGGERASADPTLGSPTVAVGLARRANSGAPCLQMASRETSRTHGSWAVVTVIAGCGGGGLAAVL